MKLEKIVKALATHVSKKDFRPALECIHVRDERTLEACDAARLLVVQTADPHGLAPGLYDPKILAACLAAGQAPPVLTEKLRAEGYAYPDTAQFIPAQETITTLMQARALCVNPLFLADLAKAAATICDEKNLRLRWQMPNDDRAPVRVDASRKDNSVQVIGVLMPMRA